MTAPQIIHISETESLPLHDWCLQQAEHFTKLYAAIPLFYTTQSILDIIAHCNGEGVLDKVLIDEEKVVAATVCRLLTRSAEIEASKHDAITHPDGMTCQQATAGIALVIPEPELTTSEIEVLEAPGLIPEPEETVEPVVESEAATEPPERQEKPTSKISEAYNAAVANQKAGKEAMRKRLTVLLPKEVGAEDRAIVDAAMDSRLDNSFTKLKEVFSFDSDFATVTILEGKQPSGEDWGRLMGLGNDLGKRSLWLLGEAVRGLINSGKEEAVHQISDAFGFSYSHASNWSRVVEHVKPEDRAGLLPSVAAEICCALYDKDPVKNQEVIDSAIKQVKEEKMNCLQARSLSRMLRGKDEEINEGKESLKDKVKRLEAALGDILKIKYEDEASEGIAMEEAIGIARKALGIIEPLAMAS
jgi:hypothetical protein